MGIYNKVLFGFIIIGFILFLSGLVSIFEVSRVRSSALILFSNNLDAIANTSMIENSGKKYAVMLLQDLPNDTLNSQFSTIDVTHSEQYFDKLNKSYLAAQHPSLLDSLRNTYARYIELIREAPEIWKSDFSARTAWLSLDFHPVSLQLSAIIDRITGYNQATMEKSLQEVDGGFYRSIMPGVIATTVGIILVILFNYFINIYVVRPILRITNGVNAYLTSRIPYNVAVQNEDEIQQLNNSIKTLVGEHRSLSKKKQ